MTRLLLATIPLLLGAACSPPAVPSIEVRDAWARATAPGQSSGAIYATLVNAGGDDDQLIGAAAPVAAMAMLHSNETVNGVARMRMLPALPVPAEGTVKLEPGSTHMMLQGLRAPLVAGERVALTLRFAKAGTKAVTATVVAPGSR
ncbi:MAG: copper chaperone PCu(A)C [Pseudomonadota bacterium]|nr:copper chaperone PCu(A)C [Pseudomonadota bacterium]